MVVISHNLADVFEVADRIFVLRLGQKAGDFEAGETNQEEVVAAITGGDPRTAGGQTMSTAEATVDRGRRGRQSSAETSCGASSRATSPSCGSSSRWH